MQTPDNTEGELTETIMAHWLHRLEQRKEPKPSTATYNAAWASCYDVLATFLSKRREP